MVRQALDRIDYRRLRVSLVNLLGVGLMGSFAAVAGIGRGLFIRTGGRVLGVASDAVGWPGPLRGLWEALGRAYGGVRDGLPAWLSTPLPASWETIERALGQAADFLVGLGLFALGAYLLVQLALLWFGALRYRDPWGRPAKPKG
ncbi:MAG: hypothetical protein HY688_05420 [Chloroflexi bacterium]|nr:hypothetical protein [Chloroflexota bacterium]